MITKRTRQSRPQLVAWTNRYLVENRRVVGRDAWVLFPGEGEPQLVAVYGPKAVAA